MRVSNFMAPVGYRLKKAGRHHGSYRGARRNLAKIAYRKAKKDLRNV